MISNVGDVHTLAYLIPTDLPPLSSNQDLAKVVLRTRPLSDDARRITSPIPFALYQHNNYVSIPAPFIPGYYAYYDNYMKTSQVPFPPSPAPFLLPPPHPTPASASLGDKEFGQLDHARTLEREVRIKDEDEHELTHKDVASKVRDALGTRIHIFQTTNTANQPTGASKSVTSTRDTRSSPDIISKCPTIGLLTIKKPTFPDIATLPSPLFIPLLLPLTPASTRDDDDDTIGSTDDESSTQTTSEHGDEDDDDLESVDSTRSDYPGPHPH